MKQNKINELKEHSDTEHIKYCRLADRENKQVSETIQTLRL